MFDKFRNLLAAIGILPIVLLATTADACISDAQANAQAAGLAHIYVDPLKGSGDYSVPIACGAQTKPCKSANYAVSIAGPGTIVHLLPTAVFTDSLFIANKKGSFAKPIIIQGDGVTPNLTKLSVVSAGNGIMLEGLMNEFGQSLPQTADACVAYITIKNLDIKATGHSVGGPYSGVFIQNAHHIQVLDSRIHDSGGAGIGTFLSDWINIAQNTVYGNSRDVTNGIYTSGISTYQNKDHTSVDPEKSNKITISGNIIYGNQNAVPPANCSSSGVSCYNSDGNGIIIDDGRHTQITWASTETPAPKYGGYTNVTNNIVYQNGGPGILSYLSENVSIISNTVLYNLKDPANQPANAGEIMVSDSGGIKIWGNIAYSDGLGGGVTTLPIDGSGLHYAISVLKSPNSAILASNYVDYNLNWNSKTDTRLAIRTPSPAGPTVVVGTHNKFGDPKFSNPVNVPYDFRVKAGSPALGFTGMATYMYAFNDFLNALRPSVTVTGSAASVTAGAYQKPVP
jgi:parallel beta-helix repeat protein